MICFPVFFYSNKYDVTFLLTFVITLIFYNFISQNKTNMFNELKKFLFQGNILELAIAVIVAGAFGGIVSSFTNDIIMPPLGLLVGGVDFADLKWVLQAAEGDTAEVAINYGTWINSIINFLIIAVVLYYVMQVYKKMNPPAPEAPAAPAGPTQEELLTQIRDLLKK